MFRTGIQTRGFLSVVGDSLISRFAVVCDITSALFIMELAKKRRFSPVWETFDLISPNKVWLFILLFILKLGLASSSLMYVI